MFEGKKFGLLLMCCFVFCFFVVGCSSDYVLVSNDVVNNVSNNITTYINTTNNITNNVTNEYNITNNITNYFYYPSLYGCQRNGTYCDGSMGSTARTIAIAYTGSVLRCFPYVVGKSYKIDKLGVIVGTANATHNQSIKLALYSDNGFGYPDALLVNVSDVVPSATGFRGQNINSYTLSNNTLYWMCSAVNTTTTSARVNVVPISDYPNILGSSGSGVAQQIGYTVAYNFANALPNPFTSGATYVTAIYPSAYARVRTD